MKMAKEIWIQGQCQEVETCLRKNNNKKAHQLVKALTTEKHFKPTTTQDKSGKCLTEENEILNRKTEFCSDFYNYETDGGPIVLDCPQIPDKEHHLILQEEVEAAVKALKMRKSAGVDNIPADLIQARGEPMIDILISIRNGVWRFPEGSGRQWRMKRYRCNIICGAPTTSEVKGLRWWNEHQLRSFEYRKTLVTAINHLKSKNFDG